MKLYRCITPTNRLCACGRVARELKAAGLKYDEQRVALSKAPEKRTEITELTGQPEVPVLVDDAGAATYGSQHIIERLRTDSTSSTAPARRRPRAR